MHLLTLLALLPLALKMYLTGHVSFWCHLGSWNNFEARKQIIRQSPSREMLFYYFLFVFCKESLKLCFCSWTAGGPGESQHQPILKGNYTSPEAYQQRKTHSAQRIWKLSAPRARSPPGSGAGSLTASSSWAPEPTPCARLGLPGTAAGRDSPPAASSSIPQWEEEGCLCAPSFAAGVLGPGITNLHFDITPH